MGDAQTKRRDHHPGWGDDVDARGLGAALIWVMLGAISAPHHGWPFWANGDSDIGLLTVTSSYVQFGMKSAKKILTNHQWG